MLLKTLPAQWPAMQGPSKTTIKNTELQTLKPIHIFHILQFKNSFYAIHYIISRFGYIFHI